MSVDGRDEPSSTGGESGGLPSRQVPNQGGPGGSGGGGDTSGSASGAAANSGVPGPDPSVPPQRGSGSSAAEAAPGARGGDVSPPPDADLIARMRAGEDSAYEELYRRHADAVRRYARTCCRDAHTADDLTAEVFARMLQAVRSGSGPEHAVRAYLLTTVRRVAAGWTKSAKREQLVDDFAVFAAQAARGSEVSDDETLDLGADVRAMHEAEQSLAMQAFRSLPERWQAVLWHTEVEDESPSDVATLFGLDANGTRVLASRAREGLKQAYLQAHVSATLTESEECARYADRLGAYARGGLRTRAERGLRKHLEECADCRLAAGQIKEVASGIPAVVPVAVIGWFGAAGYGKVAALIGGGVAGAGAAGAAGAAAGSGSGGAGAAGGGAAAEGLGTPAKVGIVAGVVAAGVAVAVALAGGPDKKEPPEAKPQPTSAQPPVIPRNPPPSKPLPKPEPPPPPRPKPAPPAKAEPKPKPPPKPAPKPTPKPPPPKPKPKPPPPPAPRPTPPRPTPTPRPTPSPTPPPAPVVYQWNELEYGLTGDGTKPEMRLGESSWVWQRWGMSIGDKRYGHGVTVHGSSSVTIDLNRTCSSYEALVGVDDMTMRLGQVRFSVYADGVRLWQSQLVKGGDPAVPVRVGLTGRKTIRLVVEPHTHFDSVALADWAQSRLRCT
ncbi:sigma-70 family RNA polymerase sigma factor [Streptomyces sp. NPDC047071]|uniref:sigma-70 family RNA polymerase sigma factor n=1 Tax=Streptomyces sp. NPDC047071 TaxID=3154808 RepID=UPI0034572749